MINIKCIFAQIDPTISVVVICIILVYNYLLKNK